MISLTINGEYLDLEKDTSITLEKIIRDPSSLRTEQAEMSFSFSIPSTRKNDRLLGYGSIFEHPNKFSAPLEAVLYIDDYFAFNGNLLINEYDGDSEKYGCNLVVVKINDLDSIFGDETLNDLQWFVDFSGATTVNSVNADLSSPYYFPFVCYGAFIKEPYYSDSVGDNYTSKFDWDEYNRAYIETFYPHISMLGLFKKLFEDKGFSIGGTAFSDPILNNIYMSVNLADEQHPTYNLGNELFGDISITNNWVSSREAPLAQTLKYPIYKIGEISPYRGVDTTNSYNFEAANIWNMLSSVQTKTMTHNSYLYSTDENIIVIPKSGFYKINLTTNVTINTASTMTAYLNYINNNTVRQKNFTFSRNIFDNCPIEIQLVKNYNSDIELIRGRKTRAYRSGDPNSVPNFYTDVFPHEDIAQGSPCPTELNGASGRNVFGFEPSTDDFIAYDQVANPNFICGISSLEDGCCAVIKNGYSWAKSIADKKESFYTCQPYAEYFSFNGLKTTWPSTNKHNLNTLSGSTNSVSVPSAHTMSGQVQCTVWLEKDDKLELMALERAYYNQAGQSLTYAATANTTLQITAISNKSFDTMTADGYNWNTPTYYNEQLNLGEFLSSGTAKKDFIENVLNSFNLQLIQIGNDITIDEMPTMQRQSTVIAIDDRVDYRRAKSSRIEFPSQISVNYKINDEEWGFESSVPQAYINDENWKDYADIGSDVIKLDEYSSQGAEDISSDFSYTWYNDFKFYQITSSDTKESSAYTSIALPVISKAEYMIDGYKYEDAMKHDGFGLTQRLFFRQSPTSMYVWARSNVKEQIYLSLPTNRYNNIELSYKNNERSILSNYFSIEINTSSNIIEVKDVELSAMEYSLIRDGAKIKINDDVYLPIEIKYDANLRLADIEAIKS